MNSKMEGLSVIFKVLIMKSKKKIVFEAHHRQVVYFSTAHNYDGRGEVIVLF